MTTTTDDGLAEAEALKAKHKLAGEASWLARIIAAVREYKLSGDNASKAYHATRTNRFPNARPQTVEVVTCHVFGIDMLSPTYKPLHIMNYAEAEAASGAVGPRKKLKLKNLRDYDQLATDWLWENGGEKYIPLGEFQIFYGPDETGKTTAAIDLAARITRGDPGFMKGSVLWIGTSENDPSVTILPRFRAAGGDLGAFKITGGGVEGREEAFGLLTDMDLLRETLVEDVPTDGDEYRFVVIDPLEEHLGAVETWVSAEVRRALNPLIGLAKELRFTAAGIMHPKKSESLRALDDIMGTAAYHQISRSVTRFERDVGEDGEDHPSRVLMFWKKQSQADHKPKPLAFEFESVDVPPRPDHPLDVHKRASRVRWSGTTDKTLSEVIDAKRKDTREKADKVGDACLVIVAALRDGKKTGTQLRRLRDDARIAEKTFDRARTRLVDQGIIADGTGRDVGWVLRLGGQADLPLGDEDEGKAPF